MRRIVFILLAVIIALLTRPVFSVCPEMDFTGDCKVDFKDFAIFLSQWLDEGLPDDPCNMVWISIDDSGSGMRDEGGNPISYGGFFGEIAKYETSNEQYCAYLNAAMASGDIVVASNKVYGGEGTDYNGKVYLTTYQGDAKSQISYSDGQFSVINQDGFSMSDHPVVMVSWYGAAAFCDYYGYRLPTQWEWQAVADYDGSFSYGCGLSINVNIANYNASNPVGLSSYPYTSSIGHYGPYGYGVCDMAGNVREWTDSWHSSIERYRVIRGGGWYSYNLDCFVWYRGYNDPEGMYDDIGFRVCRDVARLAAIPDVIGILRADAEASITGAGFVVGALTEQYSDTVGAGKVISQNPTAGEISEAGSVVDLVVSLGVDYSVPEIVWVSVSDSGGGMKDEDGNSIMHGGFVGEICMYETRNDQYCKFLNAAKGGGVIKVYNDVVYAVSDVNYLRPYIETYAANSYSQIAYLDGEFSVRSRDGYYMGGHPVVCVSWYGADAFCDYYGYSLPTQWQWQAVADYDGSYIYGCGESIDPSKANYDHANPLGLSGYSYTSPVGYYSAYGYGVCDMAGGVWEWTRSDGVVRGGSWVVSSTVSNAVS
ncbi:MAG TPA: SUMF1/EgtB/PvdO family nonheme iron enzyme, partial [Sedimentisphaerales bacterium]|nr:SUMF1/EgtB/PvdO family nonheme iron enzyme [Sedimentisphaerales bacterium]